jgi:four helix bundle protein
MGKIERFEELQVWQSGMFLCKQVYRLTNTDAFSKDFGLKDQIHRSAISVPSNISEGFERDAHQQFLYFLTIAKGSCGEVRTQIQLAYELEYIKEEELNNIKTLCIETSQQLSGFIAYLKQFKG